MKVDMNASVTHQLQKVAIKGITRSNHVTDPSSSHTPADNRKYI